jgi:hypothetical protein
LVFDKVHPAIASPWSENPLQRPAYLIVPNNQRELNWTASGMVKTLEAA